MSTVLLGATALINTLVAITLSRSQTKSTDNFLLTHYFMFNSGNIALNAASDCDLVGYGQQICTLGSSLSLALITYRSTAMAKHHTIIWTMLIWVPVLASTFFAYSDGSSFLKSNKVFSCVKDNYSSLPVWTLITSLLIFLSVISIILGLTAIISAYSNPQLTIAKKRSQYQRLMTAVVTDSILSFVVAAAGMVITVQRIDEELFTLFQPVVNLSRLLFIPLFFLMLHSGLRKELFKVVTFQAATTASRTQTTVGPSYNRIEVLTSNEPVLQMQPIKNQYPRNSQYRQFPQPEPNGQPVRIASEYFPSHAREGSYKIDFSISSGQSSPAIDSRKQSFTHLPHLPPLPTLPALQKDTNASNFESLSSSQRLSGKYVVEMGQPTNSTRSAEMIASQEQISPRIKTGSTLTTHSLTYNSVKTSAKSESVEMLNDNSVRPRAPSTTRPKTPITARMMGPKGRIEENV